jgi:tetratricopeptide (TPR) repeat protein
MAILNDHNGGVKNAVFNARGDRIVTVSSDDSADLWDADTGSLIASLEGHTGTVSSAAFSAEGSRLITASYDATARIWPLFSSGQKPPDWFSKFLIWINGHRLAPSGRVEQLSARERDSLRQELSKIASQNPEDSSLRMLQWHLASDAAAGVSPFQSVSRAKAATDLILRDASASAALASLMLDPSNPLAQLAMSANAGHQAYADFLRKYALDRLPKDAATQLRAAEILRDQNQDELALAWVEKAIQSSTGDIKAYAIKAQILKNMMRFAESHAAWRTALASSAASGEWWGQAAFVAANDGAGDDARLWAKNAVELAPDREKALRQSGWTLFHLGDFDAAYECFREGRLLVMTPSPDQLAGLAATAWRTGKKEDAISSFRELIKNGDDGEVDWMDAKTIAREYPTRAESESLNEMRAEILKQDGD